MTSDTSNDTPNDTPHAAPQFTVDGEKTVRDWPLITRDEVERLLADYAGLAPLAKIAWHSPRPFSSAVLAHTLDGRAWFVKRHHARLRSAAGLAEEHAFIAHLGSRGLPVADVLADRAGRTAITRDDWTWEVHAAAPGMDAYRGVMSWKPFFDASHAWSAGRTLARLHLAAADYDAPARTLQPLLSSFRVIGSPSLEPALEQWVQAQPGLARSLAKHDWRADIAEIIAPAHARLAPLLPALRPLWTHGDWHASNLLWTDATPGAQVRAVLDFGLSDRTCAVYDLALAIERNAIDWLAAPAACAVEYAHIAALLDGYESLAPLSDAGYEALIALLPIVHTEFALLEVEYFDDILGDEAGVAAAYDGYLLGHARWFAQDDGQRLLAWLRSRRREEDRA
ncbi:Ser/Thr protein kinase RdoA (MazF antagonist) [Paraburkholderia bannensis]|uniref:Ser/Thr protein kinase RdoA (MazF antagonist) n=1 Tax=Paraburkholderia bannensis TaxID=765414 RepID=A0A7W9TZ01_9BURK|nr:MULTISPECIES: phosphotransferase [Paraburkholderia]MBB3258983.1 Ser/Thr protein kinase RdoA (MazF antagonist) [Paraburkholderia sp. WP4_3_2]MBB6103997.1 Ser/Thr protein kinase RdoA (MazF antagonist) [Paraburkholderia bannensis]